MVTILPPSPTPPPQPSQPTAPSVTIVSAPPAVAQLAVGTQIEATVAAVGDDGLAILNSLLGELKVQSQLPLIEDATLRLQLLRVAPLEEFLLKSIDGKPAGPVALPTPGTGGVPDAPGPLPALSQSVRGAPQSQPSTSLGGSAPGAAALSKTPAITPISVEVGSKVTGVYVRTVGEPAVRIATAFVQAAANPASSLLPDGGGKSALAGARASSENVPVQNAQSAGRSATTAATRAAPGTELRLRILSIEGPNENPAAQTLAPQSATSAIIKGVVTGATPAEITLVETDAGSLALATKNALPEGSRITFEVVSQLPPATNFSGGSHGLNDLLLERGWPALNSALTSLQQSNAATAQQISNSVMPRADNQMSAAILFFLSALRGGDVRSWLGDVATRLLDRDRGDIASRLNDDFSQMSRAFNEPGAGEWRTALVPFFDGERLDQVRMHFHGRNKEESEGEANRFIIDVELSRLGRIQLDGLVNAKQKRFDLILRTASPLSSSIRRDIYEIFGGAIEATGVTGNLVFQADATFVDIDVLTGRAREKSGLVV